MSPESAVPLGPSAIQQMRVNQASQGAPRATGPLSDVARRAGTVRVELADGRSVDVPIGQNMEQFVNESGALQRLGRNVTRALAGTQEGPMSQLLAREHALPRVGGTLGGLACAGLSALPILQSFCESRPQVMSNAQLAVWGGQ